MPEGLAGAGLSRQDTVGGLDGAPRRRAVLNEDWKPEGGRAPGWGHTLAHLGSQELLRVSAMPTPSNNH